MSIKVFQIFTLLLLQNSCQIATITQNAYENLSSEEIKTETERLKLERNDFIARYYLTQMRNYGQMTSLYHFDLRKVAEYRKENDELQELHDDYEVKEQILNNFLSINFPQYERTLNAYKHKKISLVEYRKTMQIIKKKDKRRISN